MVARIQLSALDHNENVERQGLFPSPRANRKRAQFRVTLTVFFFSTVVISCKSQFSKTTKDKVLKWVKEKKKYTFRDEVLQAVLSMAKSREQSVRMMAKREHQRNRDNNLPQNVRGDHLPRTSEVAEQLLGMLPPD